MTIDIALIYDLLHAVATHAPLHAKEYDPGPCHTGKQVMDAFGVLRHHGLIVSEAVTDEASDEVVDYYVTGLTQNGKCIRQALLQTPLAFTR
jgi:hypothetical protein